MCIFKSAAFQRHFDDILNGSILMYECILCCDFNNNYD